MRFPIFNIIILSLTFIFMLSIFYFLYKFDLSEFIGGLNNKLYIYSALICIISFLIAFCYILLKNDFTKEEIDKIFVRILFIMIFTMLWIISSYYKNKFLNILFLSILCIVNFDLIIVIKNIQEEKYKILKYLSILCISYLLFHHVVIDLLLWNYYN